MRAQREREKELEALERDTRTVFAYNVNTKADDRDLFQFFSQAGTVTDVRIITDRNTKRSKGFAYIEMSNKLEVGSALALSGQPLRGQAVMVKASEAEKNMAWEANQQATLAQKNAAAGMGGMPGMGGMGDMSAGPCKLAVSNVHPNIGDTDLQSIFSPFGTLDYATITKDAAGASTGSGFVQYKTMGDALKAVQHLHDMSIAEQNIQVTIAPVLPAPPGLPGLPGLPQMPGLPGMSNMPGMQGLLGMPAASAPEATETTNYSELDEEGGYGLKMTAQSRAQLMARLSGASNLSGGGTGANTAPIGVRPPMPAPAAAPAPSQHPLALVQGVLGPASPIPTPCLLLKNMFDPATETEPDWYIEIGEDVKEECSKFGPVLHHHVDKDSKGFVYLKFGTLEGAQTAKNTLHGRWFAGREVYAEYQFAAVYDGHFHC